jgi:hypothetical protein
VADHHDTGGKRGVSVGVVEVVVGVHQVTDGSIRERLDRREQRTRRVGCDVGIDDYHVVGVDDDEGVAFHIDGTTADGEVHAGSHLSKEVTLGSHQLVRCRLARRRSVGLRRRIRSGIALASASESREDEAGRDPRTRMHDVSFGCGRLSTASLPNEEPAGWAATPSERQAARDLLEDRNYGRAFRQAP